MGLTWTQRARADSGVSGSTGLTLEVSEAETVFAATYDATGVVACNVETLFSLVALKGITGAFVQSNADAALGTGVTSHALPFLADNSLGGSIVVAITGNHEGFGPAAISVDDTNGNVYEQVFSTAVGGGVLQLAVFVATGCAAGANTVTAHITNLFTPSPPFSGSIGGPAMAILEYPGGTGTDGSTSVDGAIGGTFNLSLATTASRDVLLTITSLGPSCGPPSPKISSPPNVPALPQRGNIDYDQVRASVRSGPAPMFLMLGTTNPKPGNVATFDASGDAIDSGTPVSPATPLNTSAALVVWKETPAGTVDGVNTAFTLATAPNPAASLKLYQNGILAVQGIDYTLAGTAITMTSAPATGAQLVAYYRYAQTTGQYVDEETPGGAVNGANTAFTVAHAPNPAAALRLYINGDLQLQGTDYTLAGTAITMTTAPTTGAQLTAFYVYSTTGNFGDNETPGGTINGANTAFTLAVAPNPAKSLELYQNGALALQGTDYTLAGTAITMTTAPTTGAQLTAFYRY